MIIMLFLLTFIVPKFESIFKDMLNGRPLPALTQYVINASNAIKEQWYYILGGLFVIVVVYRADRSGRRAGAR